MGEHDDLCDLLVYGGPFEPDCGCRERVMRREIDRLRAAEKERDACRAALDEWLSVEGDTGLVTTAAERLVDRIIGALGYPEYRDA